MFHSWTPNFLVVFSGAVPGCLFVAVALDLGLVAVGVCVRRLWFGFLLVGVQLLKKKGHRPKKPAVICGHFMSGIPYVRCSGTSAPCNRSIESRRASGLCASWLIRWLAIAGPPGASILGVEVVYFLRQPSLPGPPTGPEHCDTSCC